MDKCILNDNSYFLKPLIILSPKQLLFCNNYPLATGQLRIFYINHLIPRILKIGRGVKMVDLTLERIKQLFDQQVLDMTKKTIHKEDLFDFQFSGGWLQ